jgi:hypothetical protein
MISRSLKWIMPALLLMCVAMSAHEAQAYHYFTGYDLVGPMPEWDKAMTRDPTTELWKATEFRGYITGVCDGSGIVDSLQGVPNNQLCAVVSKFLKEHPERWSEPASLLVIDAIRKAFPKK